MSMEFVGSNRRLPVAKHLTDDEYKQFVETYAAHNRSMGMAMRAKYNLENVVKVKRSKSKPGTLEVHYADGEWWHYTPGRQWY